MIDTLIGPFAEFLFMRRALAAGVIVALAAAPIGAFLLMRRMSLTGEALSHGMLPGVAIAFLAAGFSSAALSAGAVAAGVAVAVLATLAARRTGQREDAGFAAFFTIALALGVTILSFAGANVDLTHVLFGSALSVDGPALIAIGAAATVTVLSLAVIWPALVLDTADPGFLARVSGAGTWAQAVFLGGVVLTLAAGFQAVGALMSVGLVVLPAATARLWTQRLGLTVMIAAGVGALAVYVGLVVSYATGAPAGPCIVLAAGAAYAVSLARAAAAPRSVRHAG
ncbi:MAG: metal ABC transporter permease [Alphaproteobacteria bacterium]|nr:metal ABC transporter permease [Alphaproteobacteria bacterium]